jgi:SAM-dependent methyltransferase
MDIETNAPVSRMAVQSLAALEISGAKWADRGFASDRSAQFPEFDICGEPLGETFDLIIAEQVLEHVLWPYRAVRNLWCMLKPGGVAILTASFLLHLHDDPVDCSRWTETGLRHLLAEWGFGLEERQPTWDSHRLSSNSWCRPVATGSNSAGR